MPVLRLVPVLWINVLCGLCTFHNGNSKLDLKLGLLLQRTTGIFESKCLEATALVAVEDIKNRSKLLPEFELNVVAGNGGCSAKDTLGELGKQIYKDGIQAAIGPSCSAGCVPGGYVATYHNLPLISYSCSTISMRNKTLYPTFARTRPYARETMDFTSELILRFFEDMKWESTAIIYSDDEVWRPLRTEINKILAGNNVRINIERNFQEGDNITVFEKIMEEMKVRTRIIIMLCHRIYVARMLVIADSLGMKSGFAFISLDFEVRLLGDWEESKWGKGYNAEVFNGLLDISTQSVAKTGGLRFQELMSNVTMKLAAPPFNLQLNSSQVYQGVPFIYDAIYAYAMGLRKAIDSSYSDHVERELNKSSLGTSFTTQEIINMTKTGKVTTNKTILDLTRINNSFDLQSIVKDGKKIVKNIFNLNFQGASGHVVIDSLGNRIPILEVRNFRSHFVSIAKFDGTLKFKRYSRANLPNPVFPGGKNTIPNDSPPCGYAAACSTTKKSKTTVYIGIGSPVALILVLVICHIVYRRQRYENDLLSKKSFINYKELLSAQKQKAPVSSSVPSVADSAKGMSIASTEVGAVTKGNWVGVQCFTAKFKHETVYVKKLRKTSVHVNREILIEIKECRDLHHINVNQFIGVTVDCPNICVVWNYCSKGSLRDVLSNDEIQLDWTFRVSFAVDIAAGMAELHDSTIGIHGNLTSNNVLIDTRWTCKISDYGLEKFNDFRDFGKRKDMLEYQKYKVLMWRAPELLSMNVHKQSKAGDVYGYGIILSEIITRMIPYENYGYGPKDIIHFIQRHCEPPFRPHVRLESGIDGRILDLMRRCWADLPQDRPSFRDVVNTLKHIRKERNDSNNLVDNMLAMMEKYTIHLEKTVSERTDQLEKEKEKVETVLYKMLPKAVAEKLKLGESVRPQTFNSVSVLVTDIVGFTSITRSSTPLEVIDLLNDLYVLFDQTVDKFDCFKLETEGERYIVVAGIPFPNGNKHVAEIATMSLHLLNKVSTFKMRHFPTKTLFLRMALHTGPCAAGIVGLKMPRYCIFGDSVQFVRHLESSGPPLRIQVSPEFNAELEEIGGFTTEVRGPIQIKGRGLILPFFLTGKDGLDISLPEPIVDSAVDPNWNRNLIPKLLYRKPVVNNELSITDLSDEVIPEEHKTQAIRKQSNEKVKDETKKEEEKHIEDKTKQNGRVSKLPLTESKSTNPAMNIIPDKGTGRGKGLGYSRRRVGGGQEP